MKTLNERSLFALSLIIDKKIDLNIFNFFIQWYHFCPEGTVAEVRDFASQIHYENVIPRDPGLMVFSNSPSRVFCGALCSTYKTFCKTFLYDLVTKHCFLWDKTFEDSCATDIMPSTGIQAYGFNFIGKLIIAYNWKISIGRFDSKEKKYRKPLWFDNFRNRN